MLMLMLWRLVRLYEATAGANPTHRGTVLFNPSCPDVALELADPDLDGKRDIDPNDGIAHYRLTLPPCTGFGLRGFGLRLDANEFILFPPIIKFPIH